jgi:hypothetical protein
MTLLGAQSSKEEPAEDRLVDCTQIRYSQASCARRFRRGPYAGRLLANVVDDLLAERLNPGRDDWLTLDVIEKEGKLISIDNRRLWCLKEFYLRGNSPAVYAKIRVKCGKIRVCVCMRVRVKPTDKMLFALRMRHLVGACVTATVVATLKLYSMR